MTLRFLAPLIAGLSLTACSGGGTAPADAGTAPGDDAASGDDGGLPPPSDAGPMPVGCTFDTTGQVGVPASGTVDGGDVQGVICAGGAYAYLEYAQGSRTLPPQLVMIVNSATSGDPAKQVSFTVPANATGAQVGVLAGVTAASPGTYDDNTCGSVVLCVSLPVPSSVDCGDASANCPPGCAPMGPVSSPTCQPVTPTQCYQAKAHSDCVAGTQAPAGSWSIALTYVAPFPGEDGGPGTRFITHGSLTAHLVEDITGTPANLTLSF